MKALNNLVLRRTSTYFAGIALSVFFFERGFDLATDTFFRSYNKGVSFSFKQSLQRLYNLT